MFMAFFAVGPGVCVWLALSELMPTRIRSNGMSIALVLNQAVSTTIAAIFLAHRRQVRLFDDVLRLCRLHRDLLRHRTWFLPETKGKTLEEIEAHFEGAGAKHLNALHLWGPDALSRACPERGPRVVTRTCEAPPRFARHPANDLLSALVPMTPTKIEEEHRQTRSTPTPCGARFTSSRGHRQNHPETSEERYDFPGELHAIESALLTFEKLIIAASGSSRHAGLAGEIMIEDLSGVAVDVEYASEYCYRSTHAAVDPIVMVITQSGETADTIAAQREALTRGVKTIAISNVPDTTIVREAGAALITGAGPELSIPATKSFTTQVTILYLMALFLARKRGRMTSEVTRSYLQRLMRLPEAIEKKLATWDNLAEEFGRHISKRRSFCISAAECTMRSRARARSSSRRFLTPMPKDILRANSSTDQTRWWMRSSRSWCWRRATMPIQIPSCVTGERSKS